MIYMTCDVGDRVFFGDEIEGRIQRAGGETVKFGIQAPDHIAVSRAESGTPHVSGRPIRSTLTQTFELRRTAPASTLLKSHAKETTR